MDYLNETLQEIIEIKLKLKLKLENLNEYSFNKPTNFPKERGIYVVYEGEEVVYIGSAFGEDRSFESRCNQHIQNGSGGTLRIKIGRYHKIDDAKAIDYIIKNCKIKFIEFHKSNPRDIKLEEYLFIGIFKPKYNE